MFRGLIYEKVPTYTLYSIGFIINAVLALFLAFVVASFAKVLSDATLLRQVADGFHYSLDSAKQTLNIATLIVLLAALVQIAGIVIALFVRDKIVKGTSKIAPSIVFIILGLFCQNAFHLLGGILGCFIPEKKEEPVAE